MAALAPGDVVMVPAGDRLSRDTTDLLVSPATCSGPERGSVHWPSLPRYDGGFRRARSRHAGGCREAGTSPHQGAHGAGWADAKAKGVNSGASRCSSLISSVRRSSGADVDGETLRSIGRSYNVQRADDFEAGRNNSRSRNSHGLWERMTYLTPIHERNVWSDCLKRSV